MSRRSVLTLMLAPLFAPAAGAADVDPAVLLELNRARREREARTQPPAKPTPSARALHYDANHQCDSCGYESPAGTGTWIVTGSGPDGSHTHRCPRCGTEWYHGGHSHPETTPAETPAPYTLTPAAVSGCENGRCPTVTTRRGFGLLRR